MKNVIATGAIVVMVAIASTVVIVPMVRGVQHALNHIAESMPQTYVQASH